MKKFYKLMATMFALALVVASPMGSLTAQAKDNNNYGEIPDNYGEGGSGSKSEEKSDPAPTPAPAPKVEDSSSSSSGSSSSNESHYEEPADNGYNDQNDTVQDNSTQGSNEQPKNDPDDVTTGVEGGQSFRSVVDKEHTQYDVYHKGSSVASFSVTDKDGKKVEFEAVTLEKGKDGLWYLNITFAEGVDVSGLVLNLLKGDLAYLAKELGITGIQINGKVVMLTDSKTADTGKGTDTGTGKGTDTGTGNTGTGDTGTGKSADTGTGKSTDTNTGKTTGKESDSKATEEKKDDKVAKDQPVVESDPAGYRVCWCGYTIAVEGTNGLSASEKLDWKAHASAHLKNGESTSYTDVANKSATK